MLPTALDLARCSNCQQLILWASNANARSTPLDPEPDPDGNQAARKDEHGNWRCRALKRGETVLAYEIRVKPHFATCTAIPRRLPAPVAELAAARARLRRRRDRQ